MAHFPDNTLQSASNTGWVDVTGVSLTYNLSDATHGLDISLSVGFTSVNSPNTLSMRVVIDGNPAFQASLAFNNTPWSYGIARRSKITGLAAGARVVKVQMQVQVTNGAAKIDTTGTTYPATSNFCDLVVQECI